MCFGFGCAWLVQDEGCCLKSLDFWEGYILGLSWDNGK